ncbi:MAG: MFS transporter [Dehalococcoidia bacterium]|jgi:Na+/melibiose symporter-like transporter
MPNDISPDFQRWDYVKITLFGFALTALWQSLHTIIIPLRLLDFIPETQKNTYLGILTLSGLFLAMLMQPVAGALSDCSGMKWGQRRPYILIGGVAAICILPGVGLAGGFATIFLVYCLLQLATNTAQGPFQAFIPDLVPYRKHGMASGFKALFEIVGGVVLVYISSIFMDRYSDGEGGHWLWMVLGILGLVLALTILFTLFFVKEKPGVPAGKRSSVFPALWATTKEVLTNRDMVWFLVSRLLVYMAFTTIQQFALYYLRDTIGVDDPAAATARFTIFAVAGMLIVVWPAGYFSDRIGRKPVIMIAGLLGAGGIGIIVLSQEYSTVLWAGGMLGVAMGAFNSTNWALATDLVEKGEEARYLGIANMATAGGAALARAIGPAIDYFNRQSAGLGYDFMLLVCLAYFVAGSLLILKVRQRR